MKQESLDALGAVDITEAELVPAKPQVIHQGRYRLYQNPDGGMRVQYRRDDRDQDDYFEISGAMVALSQAFAEGNMSPAQMIRRVMSLMNDMRHQ